MKLVIWDVDGTLVDSHAIIMSSMAAGMAAADLPPMPSAAVSGIVGLSLPVAVATLLPEADGSVQERVVQGYRDAYFSLRKEAESQLFPGARKLLDRLAARDDVLMAIATGKSRRGLDALLEAHGIAAYFVSLQTADNNASKPAPDMILTCLADSGVAAEDAVMIGDTTFDLEMARNAGVDAIGVAWGHHPVERMLTAEPLAIAQDFDELDALIASRLGLEVLV